MMNNCCAPPMGMVGGGMGMQQSGMGGGWPSQPTHSTVSYVDWGGRYSASPDYDAAGSPHGYYGPPAIAAMLQGAMSRQPGAGSYQQPGGAACGPCGPSMQPQCPPGYMPANGMQRPNHFNNAYPGSKPQGRPNPPDLSNDEYYQKREQEVRSGKIQGYTGKVPQGGKAFFPSEPTTPGRYTYRPATKQEVKEMKTTTTKTTVSPTRSKRA